MVICNFVEFISYSLFFFPVVSVVNFEKACSGVSFLRLTSGSVCFCSKSKVLVFLHILLLVFSATEWGISLWSFIWRFWRNFPVCVKSLDMINLHSTCLTLILNRLNKIFVDKIWRKDVTFFLKKRLVLNMVSVFFFVSLCS